MLDAPTPLERPYGSCGVRVGSGVAQAMWSVVLLAWGLQRDCDTVADLVGVKAYDSMSWRLR